MEENWFDKILDYFKQLKYFAINIWRFRVELWNFRAFDYCYNLKLFCRSLEITRDLLNDETKTSSLDAKDCAKEIDVFLRMIHDHDDSLSIAEKKFNFDFGKHVEFEFSAQEVNGLRRMINVSTQENQKLATIVCRYSSHLEEDRWNKAFKHLQKNMRKWRD